MEFWFLGGVLILIVLFLVNNFNKKKKLTRLEKDLINSWAKKKEDEYYNFEHIDQYFQNNQYKDRAYHIISDRSEKDLDINEVFKFVDRTTSKIGQQYLYYKIRTIFSKSELMKFDSLTQLFRENDKLRLTAQIELARLNSDDAYHLEELIHGKQIEKPKTLWLIYLLSLCSITSIGLAFFSPVLGLFLVPIFVINSIVHYANKKNIGYYLRGIEQLSIGLFVSDKLSELDEIKFYYKEFNFIKSISTIRLKIAMIKSDKKFDNELVFLIWLLLELIKITFNIEVIVFYSFVDSIISKLKDIEKMFLFIGEVDAAISTASLKEDPIKKCEPNFGTDKKIIAKEIIHPLVDNCVANDLSLSNKSVLLTGSNMSGKTTFIRTIAVNSILAQTLNVCFADKYSAPFFKVYSSIRITDDLLENNSYYLEEVLTVKELIQASMKSEPCLFVLDEIFKGTNTIERIAGGKSILSFLNKTNHTVLVSTHDIELTDLLEKENYDLYHFSEGIENNELTFDYRIKMGRLKTRNAIQILELYEYPPEVIKEARKIEDFLS